MKRKHAISLAIVIFVASIVSFGFGVWVAYANPDNAIRIASGDLLLESGSIQLDDGNFNVTGNFFVNGTSGIVLAKGGFASMLWDVAGGNWETAMVNTEYYSPNQHGGIYGTVYRTYFGTSLPSYLTGGNTVSALVDYAVQFTYSSSGSSRAVAHGSTVAYGSADSRMRIDLSGMSGSGNLSYQKSSYVAVQGWVDYTKP